MPIWEYIVIALTDSAEQQLNGLGAEGWELVSAAFPINQESKGYLKRQKLSNSDRPPSNSDQPLQAPIAQPQVPLSIPLTFELN